MKKKLAIAHSIHHLHVISNFHLHSSNKKIINKTVLRKPILH